MEVKCLECGAKVPQTPGKRKKEYCGPTCRTKYWKKKKDANVPKRGPGRPKKEQQELSPATQYYAERMGLSPDGLPTLKEAEAIHAERMVILTQIENIKAEKIPSERDKSAMGRKSWALDQKKRIEELEKQLK